MAFTNVVRAEDFHTKKLLSQMVINVDEESKVSGGIGAAGNYLVAHLPEDCIIQSAFVFTTVASAAAADIDIGTTEGGVDIMADGDANVLGMTGTPAASMYTGTGKDVYMATAADNVAEYYVVIQYLELKVSTGSMTRI